MACAPGDLLCSGGEALTDIISAAANDSLRELANQTYEMFGYFMGSLGTMWLLAPSPELDGGGVAAPPVAAGGAELTTILSYVMWLALAIAAISLIGFGVVLGLLVAALSPVLPRLFTSDPAVQAALTAGLLVIGLTVPISGHAFVLDGVLIGAGDGTHLAVLQLIALVAYLPVLAVVFLAGEHLMAQGAPLAIAAVWAAMAWFMLLRSLLLHRRARTDKWLITGV